MINTYKIAHVSDFLNIPKDRLATCISELENVLNYLRTMVDVVKAISPNAQISEIFPEFTWVDDGKRDVYPVFKTTDLEQPKG